MISVRSEGVELSAMPMPIVSAVQEEKKEVKSFPLPEFKLTLDKLIKASTLSDPNPEIQTNKIIQAFNIKVKPGKSAVTTVKWNPFRGERLGSEEFLVVHRNQVPELVASNKFKIALAITGIGTITRIVTKIKMDTPVYNSPFGVALINVPVNHVALATTGTDKTPIILGPGPHVIHDPTLTIEEKTAFKNILDTNYFQHGNIHFLRVPPGKYAKVWIDSEPFLLPSNPTPYIYQGNFRVAPDNYLVDVSEPYIKHDFIHLLRIPAGKVAKIWEGTTPVLLKSRPEVYEYRNPLLKVEPFSSPGITPYYFEDEQVPYINHGTIHKLRVPIGKVARIMIGSEAEILEGRSKIYEFDTPLFRVEQKPSMFLAATDKFIDHYNIKRIMPDTGEVGIGRDGGQLEILRPQDKKDNKAIMRKSDTYRFDGFLETNLKQLSFPSEKAKEEKRKETKDSDEINYEIYTLGDGGLRIGVKLNVTFSIPNPELAVQSIGNRDEIYAYIESMARIDMAKVMQTCSSRDFSNFQHTTAQRAQQEEKKAFDMLTPVPENKFLTVLDVVRGKLAADLHDFGINLLRVNSDAPHILNKDVISKMEQYALANNETAAKASALENESKIARMTAEKNAAVKKIEQDQINAALVASAEAKRLAAETEAKAQEAKAKGDANAANIAIKARAEGIELEAKAKAAARELEGEGEAKALKVTSAAQAEAFEKSPELFRMAMAKELSNAVKSMNVTVGSEHALQLASSFATMQGLSNAGFFSVPAKRAPAENKEAAPVASVSLT